MGKVIAIRDAYGTTLKELGEQNTGIVGLEADVMSPIKSGIFGKAFPERYFSVGISELNTVSMAVGSARKGMIPYVDTFAVFMTTRGTDPIQSLTAYDNLNVKLCGTYCGSSDSYDGANRQAITDLAFVRATPNMAVITATDGAETRKTVSVMAEHDGPVYLRLSWTETPVYYSDGMDFQIGRGITVGEGGDMTIITTGTVLRKALEAADLLAHEGISATVMNMHTIKPIDRDLIIQCTVRTGAIVTVEGHNICGGLGSVMAEVLAENKPAPMKRIGAVDFAKPGDYGELLVKYGYSPRAIADKCRTMIRRGQGGKPWNDP